MNPTVVNLNIKLKTLITRLASQAVALMLTSFEYAIDDEFIIERLRAAKNPNELSAIKEAYLQDSAAIVQFFAWFAEKMRQLYDYTESEALARLTQYRVEQTNYVCASADAIATTSGPLLGRCC